MSVCEEGVGVRDLRGVEGLRRELPLLFFEYINQSINTTDFSPPRKFLFYQHYRLCYYHDHHNPSIFSLALTLNRVLRIAKCHGYISVAMSCRGIALRCVALHYNLTYLLLLMVSSIVEIPE